MSDQAVDTKVEMKQASKEVKESENVAEKYSAMTVSKNSEMNMGELSSSFSAVPTHKPVKKVRPGSLSWYMQNFWHFENVCGKWALFVADLVCLHRFNCIHWLHKSDFPHVLVGNFLDLMTNV